MLKNYLKTAVRNLWRSRTSTFINISGLTLGVASSLILFLLIKHHLSFDTYHTRKDRIYRVVTESDGNHGRTYTPGVPPAFPDAFKNDFREAEEVTFLSYRSGSLVTIPQPTGEPKKYEEKKGITFAQSNFFNLFDRKILVGTAEKALDDPNEAVISKRLALKYFGREDPMDEVVKFDNKEYKITAVMEDCPSNTDFPFDLMLSYVTIKKEHEKNGWSGIWSDEQCYFSLKQGSPINVIAGGMPAFWKKYHGENDPNRNHQTFVMQPLSSLHFDDRYGNYNYNTVGKQQLLAFAIIAMFLIITASINFINLTTAEAITRSKEVGIRKTLGSSRGQLMGQFLGETTLVTVIAVLAAIGITQVALSFLNPFLELKLLLNFMTDTLLWAFMIGITLSVALLSGLYPALVVSGFKPAQALKNQISNKNSSGYTLRRSLVVMQFFISQFFIIGTIVLIDQMNYFQNKELGFKKDAIITVPVPAHDAPDDAQANNRARALRDELSRLSGIEMASLSNTPPASGSTSNTNFTIEGNSDHYRTQVKLIDGNYLNLFGLKLLAGENVLDLDTARGFVVNEKLASTAGFKNPQEIVGKKIQLWGKDLPVVGVVQDFHTVSLREPIEATILFNRIRNYETLSLKVNPKDLQGTVKQVQQKWESTYPDFIFSYRFMDEQIREFYEGEQKMSVMLSVFTSLAIFIGCLGLFGLATFMANQKTKEIGVRKVMGASVESIVLLFSKEYVKLIVIGFLLAAPCAWYVMNEWLNDFAYKIEIGPSIFATGLVVTLLIALVTVGYRSLKAATVNPINSLRSE
ncbi:MAG TPA: ABC transporter permease [Cyclobacteriaceae bacterium]|nr:ABC transporter permease [Cyclobacteriaceae bacterium]